MSTATPSSFISFYICPRWYATLASLIVLFLLAFFMPMLYLPSMVAMAIWAFFTLLDVLLLFILPGGLVGTRKLSSKWSLGDPNEVVILLHNQHSFSVNIKLIEELPPQLQLRHHSIHCRLRFQCHHSLSYNIRPTSRGIYSYGRLLAYISSPIGFLSKRIALAPAADVRVYPSFHHLKQYQLIAQTTNYQMGETKIRRIGNSLEFEKIKDYSLGDDIRNINWAATARRGSLMTNIYTDARQQQIYCVIDKGRSMKMPFDQLSLLDHSINAALAVLHIALRKQDKAGLITFATNEVSIIPAERVNNQFLRLQDALFAQTTSFAESDFDSLRSNIHQNIGQRSFLMLFTNFETVAALQRQLPKLQALARKHLLCVVLFENTLVSKLAHSSVTNTVDVYTSSIAQQFLYEKKQIIRELRRHGILALLSSPQQLSTNVIRQYLALKSSQQL